MKKILFLILPIYILTGLLAETQISADNSPQQAVIWQGSNVYVTFKYNPKVDMHLVFGPCGVNNSFNLNSIYLTNNPYKINPWITRKSRLFLKSTTDWLGPYMVKCLTKGDGSLPVFTGGWHGSNGNGTGVATSKMIGMSVKVNGQAISKSKPYYGNVEVNIENVIQAYNTINSGVCVLKEAIKLSFTPKKVGVVVTTTALEDVLLEKYYGLQVQSSSWRGQIQYSNGKAGTYGKYSDSGPANKSIANSFTISSPNGAYKLKAKMDREYGLGKFEYLSPERPSVFAESYGKVYFNLINGNSMKVLKGKSLGWKGHYEFL